MCDTKLSNTLFVMNIWDVRFFSGYLHQVGIVHSSHIKLKISIHFTKLQVPSIFLLLFFCSLPVCQWSIYST